MIGDMPAMETSQGQSGPRFDSRLVRRAGLRRLLVLSVVGGMLSTAAADEALVTITGGTDPRNPQFYRWSITNNHTSPVVFIEFPHYHADTFAPPSDWAQEWNNRSMVGGRDAPGWVRTSVETPTLGIQPGATASFEMRLARAGADTRPGKVAVRFADGTQTVIAGVLLPSAKPFLERNALAIGLAVIFVTAVLIHLRRRRKRPPAAASSPTAARGPD
jgi:hypothetical protein